MITSSCNLFSSFSTSRHALGPPLIYLLKNCCLFFTGLFDESYFLDDRQVPQLLKNGAFDGRREIYPDHGT